MGTPHRLLAALPLLLLLGAAAPSVLAEPPAAARKAAKARAADDAQRIDLDLYEADLRNVLRLLAEVGGVNLVVGEGVDGRVTMRLQRVHWKDALKTILSLHGLEAELNDNILRVAPAADFAEQRQAKLTKREQCLASAPLQTRLIPVSHARAEDMARLIRPTLSKRGTASADARTNTVIVRDVVCK